MMNPKFITWFGHREKRKNFSRQTGLICALLISGIAYAKSPPKIAECDVFPADHIWNVPVDNLPVDANSDAYITTIGTDAHLHPDFGSWWEGIPIGIPYNIVSGLEPKVSVNFDYYSESDPGPYPIPPSPSIEGGDDRHLLVVDRGNCVLYELYRAILQPDGSWHAGSGAIFDLKSYQLRPETWTSADAAGLPSLEFKKM